MTVARRARLRLAVAACLCLLPARECEAAQAQVPANDGWVTDLAHVLTASQEAELEKLMSSYQAGSGHDVALLTVRDLGGRTLEELALQTARAWKLGQRDLHDGALLLVAVAERRMRIEVGRGLEGTLTDLTCGSIIRDVIAPRLRDGAYYDGLRAGLLAIHAAAGGGYAPPASRQPGGGPLVFLVFVVLLVLLLRLRARSRRPFLGPAYRGSWFGGYGGFSRGGGGSFSGGGFSGFGGGGGFSGGGASGGW